MKWKCLFGVRSAHDSAKLSALRVSVKLAVRPVPKTGSFFFCLLCIKILLNIITSKNNIVLSVWNGSSIEYLIFYVQELPLFWFSSSYFSGMRLNPWEYVTNVCYWKMYIPCYLKHLITNKEKKTNIKQIIKTSFSISRYLGASCKTWQWSFMKLIKMTFYTACHLSFIYN